MKKDNFTLIELLLVVTIIAILAGMLLPVLQQARERGKSIACIGNLKQYGVAAAGYSNDYREYIPFAYNGDDTANYSGYAGPKGNDAWYVYLGPYMGWQKKSFMGLLNHDNARLGYEPLGCPAQTIVNPTVMYSYSVPGWVAIHVPTPNGNFYQGRISQIIQPSKRIFIYDVKGGQYTCSVNTMAAGEWSNPYPRRHVGQPNTLLFGGNVKAYPFRKLYSLGMYVWHTPFTPYDGFLYE